MGRRLEPALGEILESKGIRDRRFVFMEGMHQVTAQPELRSALRAGSRPTASGCHWLVDRRHRAGCTAWDPSEVASRGSARLPAFHASCYGRSRNSALFARRAISPSNCYGPRRCGQTLGRSDPLTMTLNATSPLERRPLLAGSVSARRCWEADLRCGWPVDQSQLVTLSRETRSRPGPDAQLPR